jgi:hypothetical protein
MRASARLSKRPCRRRAPAWTKAILSSFAWRTVRWRLLVIDFVPASARVTIDCIGGTTRAGGPQTMSVSAFGRAISRREQNGLSSE